MKNEPRLVVLYSIYKKNIFTSGRRLLNNILLYLAHYSLSFSLSLVSSSKNKFGILICGYLTLSKLAQKNNLP